MPHRDPERENALTVAIHNFTIDRAVIRYVRTLNNKKAAVTLRNYADRVRLLVDEIYQHTRRGARGEP